MMEAVTEYTFVVYRLTRKAMVSEALRLKTTTYQYRSASAMIRLKLTGMAVCEGV